MKEMIDRYLSKDGILKFSHLRGKPLSDVDDGFLSWSLRTLKDEQNAQEFLVAVRLERDRRKHAGCGSLNFG